MAGVRSASKSSEKNGAPTEQMMTVAMPRSRGGYHKELGRADGSRGLTRLGV
ncbi:hypothetical protein ACO22_05731 [Paracoccidioides brasiliensis]|uniref:Uncharacterized protein n=1 Tax=Paracoccidioides brasiliensis TaxID=121759 RepID=A0A1D2J9M1_PARBR|nr:hypothetical protein ACO22_05731 [Paracoccidioides brasiliensis]ODH47098.1 hypothetical protein GX48_06811 [Paracoccidioides brasiliensis]